MFNFKRKSEDPIFVPINAIDNGLRADGTTGNASQLIDLINSIGSNPAEIIFSKGIYVIDANVTIPANVVLNIENGAVLSVASTKTLTINGEIKAGLYQIFSGAGTVAGSARNIQIYPEWWGAVISSTVNSNDAFEKCFNFAKQSNRAEEVILTTSYMIDNKSFYLDFTDITKTITIKGHGQNSFIRMNGYDTDKYLFYVNETPQGANAIGTTSAYTRVICENFFVYAPMITGEIYSSARFMKARECPVEFKKMYFEGLKYGLVASGYCDQMRLDMISWAAPAPGGWMYYNPDQGDSLFISQLFTSEHAAVYLGGCGGASIIACNGGHYHFVNSNAITIQNWHQEFMETAPGLKIQNSRVTIDTCHLRSDSEDYSPIWIEDTTGRSQVTIRNTTFPRTALLENARKAEVWIEAISDHAKITIEDSFASVYGAASQSIGVNVASNVSGLSDALTKNMHLMGFNALIYKTDGVWNIMPSQEVDGVLLPPSLTVAISSNAWVTNFGTGTYYYKFQLERNGVTESLPESSVVKTTASQTIQLTGYLQKNSKIRIFRGTSSGVYTKEIVLPIVTGYFNMIDLGVCLTGGYQWFDIQSTPSTVNTTKKGKLHASRFGLVGDGVTNNSPLLESMLSTTGYKNLLSNGNFASATSWTAEQSYINRSVANNQLTLTAQAGNFEHYNGQVINNVVAGRTYFARIKVDSVSVGKVAIYALNRLSNGNYEEIGSNIISAGQTGICYLKITPTSVFSTPTLRFRIVLLSAAGNKIFDDVTVAATVSEAMIIDLSQNNWTPLTALQCSTSFPFTLDNTYCGVVNLDHGSYKFDSSFTTNENVFFKMNGAVLKPANGATLTINGKVIANSAIADLSLGGAIAGAHTTDRGSASPVGAVLPNYIGEEYLDTSATPKKWYKSTGLTNADWVALN